MTSDLELIRSEFLQAKENGHGIDPDVCAHAGCERPRHTRGLCRHHYYRLLKYGVPADKPRYPPAEERFLAGVDFRGPDECWLWKKGGANGYGTLTAQGKHISAHRFSYQHFVGPIPDGLVLDHLCRVRNCVNPAHLEPVTPAENHRRGLRGRLHTHCKWGHEKAVVGLATCGRGCGECERIREKARCEANQARRPKSGVCGCGAVFEVATFGKVRTKCHECCPAKWGRAAA